MNKYTINNQYDIVSGELHLYSEGTWVADLAINTTEALPTEDLAITMTWIDDTKFVGTLGNNTIIGGKTKATILGGTARMSDVIEQKQYQSVTMHTVIEDIATATGHTLSNTIDPLFTNKVLAVWNRLEDQASSSLGLLLNFFDGIWQILPDGTLWVGPNKSPESFTVVTVLERSPNGGYWKVYNDEVLLRPPFTLEGNKISEVVYTLKNNKSTAMLVFSSIQDIMYDISSQEVINSFRAMYRCRIVSQNADGSFELQLDPAISLFKNGLSKVPYCPPSPNMKITPALGTHCVVAFLNGNPAYPRVVAWDDFIQPTKVEVSATGAKAAARVEDECGYLVFTPNAGPAPAVLTYSPIPVPVTPPVVLIGPIKIQKGSPDVFIG